ncbi:MAG: LuxR C-terminal-related transcriptional regulator [Sphingomonas sp.]
MSTPVTAAQSDDPEEIRRLIELLRRAERSDKGAIYIGEFTVGGTRVPLSFVAPLQGLTRAEAAVVRFLGWGRSNADIATLLAITENTVRVHCNNVIRKLEVDGMRGLVSLAGLLFHPLE